MLSDHFFYQKVKKKKKKLGSPLITKRDLRPKMGFDVSRIRQGTIFFKLKMRSSAPALEFSYASYCRGDFQNFARPLYKVTLIRQVSDPLRRGQKPA